MKNRVVVTGYGAVTPIGNNTDEFWNALKNNKCGIDRISRFDTTSFNTKLSAEVKDFDMNNFSIREQKNLPLHTRYAISATKEAIKMSGIENNIENPYRFGVIIGSAIGGIGTIEEEHKKLIEDLTPRHVSPYLIPKVLVDSVASNISILINAKGYCMSCTSACSSSNTSIGEAYRQIKYGYQDIMICGGAESPITPLSVAGFEKMRAMSTSININRASIPFDAERNGFVIGEGSGILLLENLEYAKKRKAKIYAEIVGYGFTSDAYHIVRPNIDGEQQAQAMQFAIDESGISIDEIKYINAHGTGTVINDETETLAIKKVFGKNTDVKISSTKSFIGHLMGAAGSVELIATIMAMNNNYILPTINYKLKDEKCDLNYVANEGLKQKYDFALSNSFGFGGKNTSILVKKWSEDYV